MHKRIHNFIYVNKQTNKQTNKQKKKQCIIYKDLYNIINIIIFNTIVYMIIKVMFIEFGYLNI